MYGLYSTGFQDTRIPESVGLYSRRFLVWDLVYILELHRYKGLCSAPAFNASLEFGGELRVVG